MSGLIFPIHPILKSKLVKPDILPLDQELKDCKVKIDEFHEHKKEKEDFYGKTSNQLDPFNFYRKQLKSFITPEASITNAWLKCWEMVHVFQLIPYEGSMKIFCNAELPGAFLFALHHFIYTKTRVTYDWVANSLFPSNENGNENILGDYFGIYKNFPDKWLMSKECNGDVTNPDIIKKIRETCGRTIDLYTSDIGIGLTHETFNMQEQIEAPLHLGQTLCGLQTLKIGGHMVCKTFMFFYPFSISLMYLTSLCFTEFFIHKPQTSRPNNSEVYVIGKGFIHNHHTEYIINLFTDILSSWNISYMDTYMVDVPEDFYLKIVNASTMIYKRQMAGIYKQIETINDLYLHRNKLVRDTSLFKSEQIRLQEWKKMFPIPKLDPKSSLFTVFKQFK